jgi:hypothetical protein
VEVDDTRRRRDQLVDIGVAADGKDAVARDRDRFRLRLRRVQRVDDAVAENEVGLRRIVGERDARHDEQQEKSLHVFEDLSAWGIFREHAT